MAAAQWTRLEAYIMSLLAGLRTEAAWALRWDYVVAWVDGQWQPVAEAGFDHEQVVVRRTGSRRGRCGRITTLFRVDRRDAAG